MEEAQTTIRPEVIVAAFGEQVGKKYTALVGERKPATMAQRAACLQDAIASEQRQPQFCYAPGKTTAKAVGGEWNPDA